VFRLRRLHGRLRSLGRPAQAQILAAMPADAVLVLCDAADCPAIWGSDALKHLVVPIRGAAVMAQREYEA
jgi:hypothetical protein